MPQINLLSSSYSKKKKKDKPLKIPRAELSKISSSFLPVSYAAIIVLSSIWLILSFVVLKERKELANLEKKERALSASPQEINQLILKKDSLNKKIVLLDKLSSRNFFWSDKLRQIAEFIPDGVWLREISLDRKILKVEDSKKKEVSLPLYLLNIKGGAFAYKIQDAINLIGQFNNSLKQDEQFTKDFSNVKLETVAKSTIAKTDIMNFEFKLDLR